MPSDDTSPQALAELLRKDVLWIFQQKGVISDPVVSTEVNPNDPDHIGRLLIMRAGPQINLSLSSFLMTSPEAGLTLYARTTFGAEQAAMVTISHEVLQQQGQGGAEPALTYLLKVAQLGLLPRIVPGEQTPLVGVWRVDGVHRQLQIPDDAAP